MINNMRVNTPEEARALNEGLEAVARAYLGLK